MSYHRQMDGCQQPSIEEMQYGNVIWSVNSKSQVMDFRSQLVYADEKNFANIHGRGGKNRARNSTIECVICDFSRGTGSGQSVTVSYRIEAEDIDLLYQAAKDAYFGKLGSTEMLSCVAHEILAVFRTWLVHGRRYDNAFIGVTENEIVTLGQKLGKALEDCCWEYTQEKSNPHARNESTGMAPVYKIRIVYTPMRDGQRAKYPWNIFIENFDAPLTVRQNGSSSHNSKEGVNRRSAYIMVSALDFARCMKANKRYIHNWEALFREVVKSGLCRFRDYLCNTRNQNNHAA